MMVDRKEDELEKMWDGVLEREGHEVGKADGEKEGLKLGSPLGTLVGSPVG
jgi:hypothetical protein